MVLRSCPFSWAFFSPASPPIMVGIVGVKTDAPSKIVDVLDMKD